MSFAGQRAALDKGDRLRLKAERKETKRIRAQQRKADRDARIARGEHGPELADIGPAGRVFRGVAVDSLPDACQGVFRTLSHGDGQ